MQARKFRHLQQLLAAPLVLAFGEVPVPTTPGAEGLASADVDGAQQRTVRQFSILTEALPPNVHLLTLQALGGGRVLLRLAHLYEGNRDGKGWCAFFPSPGARSMSRVFDMDGRLGQAYPASVRAPTRTVLR